MASLLGHFDMKSHCFLYADESTLKECTLKAPDSTSVAQNANMPIDFSHLK